MASIPTEEQVIQLVKEYFKDKRNKVLNLSNFVKLNNPQPGMGLEYHISKSIAATLKEYGEYEIETEGGFDATIYFVKRVARKKFNEREPFWFAVIIAVISAGLALGGKWLTEIKAGQAQHQRDSLQDLRVQRLSDSLSNYQKQLADSVATLRADTSRRPK